MSEKSKEFAFQLDQLKKKKNVPEAPKEAPVQEAPLTFRGNEDPVAEPVQEAPKQEQAFAEKVSLNINLNEVNESETLLQFKKDEQYYQDLDINMDDLEQMELRIEELESYLGIEYQNDI